MRNLTAFLCLTFAVLLFSAGEIWSGDIPENAYVSGNAWYCNTGYRKSFNKCTEMTSQEKQEKIRQIQAFQASQRNKTINYDDEEFTLRDVERKCEVYRYSDSYGDLECSDLRFIERKCEAYFSGEYAKNGDIECSDSDLRPVENYCSVSMYSDNYGDIEC